VSLWNSQVHARSQRLFSFGSSHADKSGFATPLTMRSLRRLDRLPGLVRGEGVGRQYADEATISHATPMLR